ncbi:hypothetical protein BN59_00032 [Legionella massiliensis]|uniref:Uncharacterized protein n=1 Tax=Legionella massiliensis TaxID=1034943 RepID=A0A078KVH3_9GAMM|nr:hypothetical protein [Legionella massiliensis]CDZ75774.1 hypothetical protein BN59_00032 [Legionella massiliensis]CEE11512.1 hypothetical protein BN1094_00032 [Legionella massiliensis]
MIGKIKRTRIQEIIALGNSGEALQSTSQQIVNKAVHIQITAENGNDDRVQRISKHLEKLAQAAQEAHLEEVDATEDLLVTRLIMDEFSLYTKNSPLSIDEYKQIIFAIERIASKLSPDIHLVIASAPVLWPDNTIHNCALYIQSPSTPDSIPVIHHFEKTNYADVDFRYINTTGQAIPLKEGSTEPTYQPKNILQDTPVKIQDINQYKSALKIITSEGSTFLTAIDICLDHRYRVAETNLKQLIKQLNRHKQEIPLYISQVISSHTIAPIRKNVFTALTQADSKNKSADGMPERATKILQSEFGNSIQLTTYSSMRLEMPFRKRILRALQTEPQTILAEALENPGARLYLTRRLKALIKIGAILDSQIKEEFAEFIGDLSSDFDEPFDQDIWGLDESPLDNVGLKTAFSHSHGLFFTTSPLNSSDTERMELNETDCDLTWIEKIIDDENPSIDPSQDLTHSASPQEQLSTESDFSWVDKLVDDSISSDDQDEMAHQSNYAWIDDLLAESDGNPADEVAAVDKQTLYTAKNLAFFPSIWVETERLNSENKKRPSETIIALR